MAPSTRQRRKASNISKPASESAESEEEKDTVRGKTAKATKGAKTKNSPASKPVAKKTKNAKAKNKKVESDDESKDFVSENEAGDTSSNSELTESIPAKRSPAKRKSSTVSSESKSSKKEKNPEQRITERDPLPKLWKPSEHDKCFKILSWNVDGLRAVMKNLPTAMSDLVKKYDYPDLVCLQETKLQDIHVEDPKLMIKGHLLDEEGYDSYWSCSTAKKGYSGTAVFIKRKGGKSLNNAKFIVDGANKGEDNKGKQKSIESFFSKKEKDPEHENRSTKCEDGESFDPNYLPVDISYGINHSDHDSEGRSLILDYPLFTVLNLYVPNSGQKLERLDYRTKEWDKHLVEFVKLKEKERGVPVIWLGDLNVAHLALDVWNEGAKHLAKSAGTTPQERESFSLQLQEGYCDLFRELHPEAKGQYSFWSTRAGNRQPNKGLRLDYFVGSKSLLVDDSSSKVVARDSYMDPDQLGSDHCPVILELEIKE